MIETISLDRIKKSPFRHFQLNPLRPEKLSYLTERIEKHGLLPIITLRPVGNFFESAVGHHRIQVCRNLGITEAQFLIEKLSDAEMLDRLLDDSNDQLDDMLVCTEACYNVVKALAKKLVTLPEVPAKTSGNLIRYAPSFLQLEQIGAPYTASTVGQRLNQMMNNGAPKRNVLAALQILELIERKIIDPRELKTVNYKSAQWYKFTREQLQLLNKRQDPLLREAGVIL